jgi:hypothetical protein
MTRHHVSDLVDLLSEKISLISLSFSSSVPVTSQATTKLTQGELERFCMHDEIIFSVYTKMQSILCFCYVVHSVNELERARAVLASARPRLGIAIAESVSYYSTISFYFRVHFFLSSKHVLL